MTDILSCPVAEYFPQSYLGRGAYWEPPIGCMQP
jgi:hypothetical protein